MMCIKSDVEIMSSIVGICTQLPVVITDPCDVVLIATDWVWLYLPIIYKLSGSRWYRYPFGLRFCLTHTLTIVVIQNTMERHTVMQLLLGSGSSLLFLTSCFHYLVMFTPSLSPD
jgi:hypothetical protein